MMGPTGAEVLSRTRTFTDIFRYLVDELHWPLEAYHLDDDDLTAITYDWKPEELGIAAADLSKLRRLRQMRPLTANQPWGVFILEFDGPRLPITEVRHLLRVLVVQKRKTTAQTHQSWKLDHLLFIVMTGTGDSLQLHLLAFSGQDARSAGFLPLAWRPVQSPRLHLQRLAEELLPKLCWPDDEEDLESWCSAWREPFELPGGHPIKNASRLAARMAKTAMDLRVQIAEAYDSEHGSGLFSTLMKEIQSRLVSDVTSDRFADMCAQTLVYGVLSSRVTDPKGFGSSPVFSTVPLANPFLEAFFKQVHDEAAALDLAGSGLPHLVADLQKTNVEAILDQFGSTVKGGDPVIHFYEQFLARYDSKKRINSGAFYTPQPAVEFMVRMVDEVLRSRFGLALGIADPSPWSRVAQRNEFEVPDSVDPHKPFVSMIDPATGTGTFLVEWLRQAKRSFLESGAADDWARHLRDHVLPSMHAFESMLGPYAIAHLKAALELHDAGADDGEMTILLTDTLDHAARQGQLSTMSDPVAEEGERAATLKESERFTIVIGNPPYDREQRALGDTARRKGGVVRHGAPGIDPLIKMVTEPMRAAGLGNRLTSVYNDYVYFWRWAVWQATELPAGPGVIAFITAASYLDGVSMGGLRNMLREAFDELCIVDLGGEGRGALTEENIFDIRTPVAIAVGVRTGQPSRDRCVVRYRRVTGTRAHKLSSLCKMRLDDAFKVVPGRGLDVLAPRSDSTYYVWPNITQLFPWIWSGCTLHRTWPIAEAKHLLERRWRTLLDAVPRERGALLKETGDRKVDSKLKPLLNTNVDGSRLPPLQVLDNDDSYEATERYGYRSLDRQWVIADNRLADRPRPQLWRVRGPRQVFCTTLTSTKLGPGPVMTVTPYVPDLHYFCGRGAKNVMPLYRYSDGREPNITKGLLTALGQRLDIEISAEDLLAYVHALAGTSAFSQRFADELTEAAGPFHVPVTEDSDLFERAVALGRDLLWWHTWGERLRTPPRRIRPIFHQAQRSRSLL